LLFVEALLSRGSAVTSSAGDFMTSSVSRVAVLALITLSLLAPSLLAEEPPGNASPASVQPAGDDALVSNLPDVPQCRGVLDREIAYLVRTADKDPRKALEAKRRKKTAGVTTATVECASRLWQALHPPLPKMTAAERRGAARQLREAEKAREAREAHEGREEREQATHRGLSAALSPTARRILTRDSRERREGNASEPVYSGAPVDLRPVTAVLAPPLRNVNPIPPPKKGENDDAEGHREPVRPPRPVDIGGPEGFRQNSFGPITSAPTATGASFDGIGVGLGGFTPASNPPDVNGHVGPTQYVQWNNTSFAVFSKAGALLYGPAAGNTLFQSLGGPCATHNDGDPVVNYDILAGRWVLSQFVVEATPSASHQCFAVSVTGDATGAYYLYDFVTDTVNFVDYPHVGVWPDGYYMTGHVFNAAGTALVAARVFVFEREKMILGQAARIQQKDLRKDGTQFQYGFLPADLDSHIPPPVGEASFVIGPNGQFTNRTDTTRVAVTWGVTPTITLTENTITTVGIGTAPCVNNTAAQDNRDCVPQPSPAVGADYLDNIEGHFMYRLAYRNFGGSPVQESLVVSGPTNGSASSPAHGAVKWIEFRNDGNSTATPTVFQSGTFDPDTAYRWLPSIAMDKDANIAVGYSKSSTSVKPGIFITGRLSTDTINTMGAEATVQAGVGSQTSGAGNRWGDYSALTLDPVDQCTFWYTNEYLKTNGAFNWSTRIAAFRFPSCTDAPAWGTISGVITSCATGGPISGAIVTLSNGFAATSDASGNYSILVPAGTYTANATATARNCTSGTPSNVSVTSTSGGTTNQNFCMTGTSNLQTNGVAIDDSSPGNNNGVVNRDECVKLNVTLKNNGCGNETAISGTLTTSTPNVTISQNTSAYPDLAVDASSVNTTPFQFQTSSSFVCGTAISFSLTLNYTGGNKVLNFSVPTCAGPDQTIPSSSLTAADLTQNDRLGRNGVPSTCAGKTSPGGGFAGTKFYKTFTFTNTSTSARCYTVNINAALGGAGDIESAAYSPTYNPAALSTNYLGDTGIVGLGTTVGSASYAFTVPASANFVVVVNTTGTTTSSVFSGTVSGFLDNNPGPGACAPCTPPPTPTATPGGPTTFCQGGSVTLTSSSATGNQWYNGVTLLPGQTNQTYVATTSGNYNVVVTVAGCPSAPSSSVSVTVNSTPTPTITPGGPTTFCTGGSVTLTSSSATGNQWYLGGNPIGGETNQAYVATASGSYTVVATANGCPSAPSSATVVTVNPIPATPTITPGGPTTFCAGGSVTLTSSSATGNQWYLNGNPIGGQTNQAYVATASGSYTVVVTTSGCSSAASSATTVTVNPATPTPTITPGGPTTFCQGGSVTLTSSSATGNQWYLNGNPIGGQTNQNYVATASGSYTVVANTNGCPSAPSTATVVTVNSTATPTITPSGPLSFCAGGSVTLTSSSATGNQWYLDGNPIGGQTGQAYIANADGSYTVIATTNGCPSAASLPRVVTVLPKPDATITVASPMFSGASSTASVNVSCDSATFAWSITGGTITSGNGTPAITFTAGPAGTLTITVTVTAANGCSDTKSANVTVQTASFGAPPAFRATSTSASSVSLNWGAVQLADHYEIQRSTDNVNWTPFGNSPGTSFSDGTVAASTVYFYRVRTVKADTSTSAFSSDVATTMAFTDDPLGPCATIVKAVHITQLRTAVNLARASLGLGAFTFTDPTLTAGSTLIKGVHITELRTALAPVLSAVGGTATYTDPTIPSTTVIIKAVHIRELRELIR
jgi:hypothetical protein